jgi:hypothetical protein
MDLTRAAIRRLRAGVVPSWEFDRLSVGYDETRKLIKLCLSALDLPGQTTPLFVRGEWGSGKTHLLSYVRAAANLGSIAGAKVDLNARNAALNYPQRFLSSVAENLQAFGCTGIKAILLHLLNQKKMRALLWAFSRTEESGEFGVSLGDLCHRFDSQQGIDLGDHEIWSLLYGMDLSWSDHHSKRDKALSRIASISMLCRAVGLKGLVLMLDEAETIDQLWNIRSRISAYHVLGSLFQMDATWCVLGSTMRFDRTITVDIENNILSYDLGSAEATEFLRRWKRNQYQYFEPPKIDSRHAKTLAAAVGTLYAAAYGTMSGAERLSDGCLREWNRNPSKNPRRLIRLLIHTFDLQRS